MTNCSHLRTKVHPASCRCIFCVGINLAKECQDCGALIMGREVRYILDEDYEASGPWTINYWQARDGIGTARSRGGIAKAARRSDG